MAYCEGCKTEHIFAKFCPEHGINLVNFHCPKCDWIVVRTDKYCNHCGMDLKENPPIKKEAT